MGPPAQGRGGDLAGVKHPRVLSGTFQGGKLWNSAHVESEGGLRATSFEYNPVPPSAIEWV